MAQYAKLHGKNNKRLELISREKKKDSRPKSIEKDLSPRPTKGGVLEMKGRKEEAQLAKIK